MKGTNEIEQRIRLVTININHITKLRDSYKEGTFERRIQVDRLTEEERVVRELKWVLS